MREIKMQDDDSPENWTSVASELNLSQLNNLDADGVNIQCINSSEFVVGKQTNFNGPVTIINCPNTKTLDKIDEPKEEKIVIRDKVLSQTAATTMEEIATGTKAPVTNVKKPKGSVKIWMIALFIAIVFLVPAAVSLVLIFDKEEVSDWPTCEQLSENVSLYSHFPFARDRNDTPPFNVSVPFVVIVQTVDNACFELKHCLKEIKRWFEKNVPCNFLLGSDGNVYEDLGWSNATPLEGPAEGKALEICFMGDFEDWEIPTYPQVEAAKVLIKYAAEKEYLSKDYVIVPSNATGRGELESNNSTLRIYSKTDWGGKPETSFIIMKLPVPYVVVSHSATVSCSTLASCAPLIQGFQSNHQSQSYADIAYNFLVDSSGNIYEGRGWVKRNVNGGFINGRNIDVCIIGDFSQDTTPEKVQMDGFKSLLEFGSDKGFLSPDYSLVAANSTYPTLSPGKHVYEIIKNWPHFDPDPKSHIKDFEE